MKIAKIISFIFNPSFVLLFASFVLVNKTSNNSLYAAKWTLISFVFLGFIFAYIFRGKSVGFFSNLDVSKREQRWKLFSIAGITTFLYLLSLMIFNGPKVLYTATFIICLGLISITILNRFIKTSVHVTTISAFVFLISIYHGTFYLLSLLLIPVVCLARIKTGRHTFKEVTAGCILGFILAVIAFNIKVF